MIKVKGKSSLQFSSKMVHQIASALLPRRSEVVVLGKRVSLIWSFHQQLHRISTEHDVQGETIMHGLHEIPNKVKVAIENKADTFISALTAYV